MLLYYRNGSSAENNACYGRLKRKQDNRFDYDQRQILQKGEYLYVSAIGTGAAKNEINLLRFGVNYKF